MSAKSFVKMALATTLAGLCIVSALNVMDDKYSVFKSKYGHIYDSPNQNFVKIAYITANKGKYDSFIFGSSRVGNIKPNSFTGGTYYNMTYSEGLPCEHLKIIKYFIKNGIPVKNVVVGLDDFSYQLSPDGHNYDLKRIPHPALEATGYASLFMSYVNFYRPYLFKKPSIRFFKKNKGKDVFFDIEGTGRPINEGINLTIESNPEKHVNDPKFLKPERHSGDRVKEALDDMSAIVSVCKTNQIKLHVFINPLHYVTYLYNDLDQMNTFKLKLSRITDFYDFSGINSITTNNYNYYETSHYREHVGDYIVRIIEGKRTPNIPDDFGVHVTPENVEQHLAELTKHGADYVDLRTGISNW